jgi:hypothetical protein
MDLIHIYVGQKFYNLIKFSLFCRGKDIYLAFEGLEMTEYSMEILQCLSDIIFLEFMFHITDELAAGSK